MRLARREIHGNDRQKRVERGHAQETQARKGASDQTRAAQKFHESTGREMSRAEAYPERRRALVRFGPCLGTFGTL